VAAAVAEARPTADQDLVRAERVAVGASSVGGWSTSHAWFELAESSIKPGPRGCHPRSGL